MDEWTNEWMNGRMDGGMNGWTGVLTSHLHKNVPHRIESKQR